MVAQTGSGPEGLEKLAGREQMQAQGQASAMQPTQQSSPRACKDMGSSVQRSATDMERSSLLQPPSFSSTAGAHASSVLGAASGCEGRGHHPPPHPRRRQPGGFPYKMAERTEAQSELGFCHQREKPRVALIEIRCATANRRVDAHATCACVSGRHTLDAA